jgi:hypothetical protein
MGAQQTSRARVRASTGREPWRWVRGGGARRLGQVWQPRAGGVDAEVQASTHGR